MATPSTKRKRSSLAREALSLRESVAATAGQLSTMDRGSLAAHALHGELFKARGKLDTLECKLKMRRQRDARRKVNARATGLVKARPAKPERTVTDELLSRQKAVTTLKARLAALPEGTDAWFRMAEALRIAEATVLKCERMVSLCAE